jgi:hypothetical protein
MSIEKQHYHPSPPPVYSLTTPTGMENERYVGDRSPVEQGEQGVYCLKEPERKTNACVQLLRLIRSNFFS